ncbi:MAG: ABC transporter permease [Actinomycetota bacterium]|nr:ABC transporter permease [Actinomycetota bacterium]
MDAPEPIEPAPPMSARYHRPVAPSTWLKELWGSRDLVTALTIRELQARYKHAVLGCLWALLVPLTLMLVFTTVFRHVAHVETGDAPYAVFAYLGLLVWTFFSTSVSLASQSLLNNAQLFNRVYFPREVFPLGAVAVAAVDNGVALVALGLLFLLTGTSPHVSLEHAPALVVLLGVVYAWTIAVALIVATAVVYLRDLRHLLPIVLQVGIIATPVAYGFDAIPGGQRRWYSLANPLGPVIDGFRRVLLYDRAPQWGLVGLGALSAGLGLVVAYAVFKRLETGLADIA